MQRVYSLVAVLVIPLFLFAQQYAIKNVSVIPMDKETVLRSQTVLISNGRIEEIGEPGRLTIPKEYQLIDGSGKFLIPGLFDMHAHFYEEQYSDFRNSSESELKMILANGITTARIMAGHPDYLQAKQNVKAGKWIGPDLLVASPQLVGTWSWSQGFKNYEVVKTKEEASRAVAAFKQMGYDAIKITVRVSRECYDAIIEAGKKNNIKIVGHVGPLVKLPAALAAGQQVEHMDEFIDMLLPDSSYNHGESVSDMNLWRKAAWATVPFLDESKIIPLAQRVKDAGIYVTPTNYFFISFFGEGRTEEQLKQAAGYAFIPEELKKEFWKNRDYYNQMDVPSESRKKYVRIRKELVNALWKAGVPLMAGSDSPGFFLVGGFSLHDELEAFVDAGLSPYAALQTATINPATFLGLTGKGVIKKGKQADLLLLDKNPLENISNTRSINAIFRNGVYYDKSRIDKMYGDAKVLLN